MRCRTSRSPAIAILAVVWLAGVSRPTDAEPRSHPEVDACLDALDEAERHLVAKTGHAVDWTVCSCLNRLALAAHRGVVGLGGVDPAALLERRLDGPPPLDGCSAYYLAQIRERAGEPARPLYEQAARAFAASDHLDGVFWARLNLGRLARQRERWRQAVSELEVARDAARLNQNSVQLRQASLESLRLRLRGGDDLRQIESELAELLGSLTDDATDRQTSLPRVMATLGEVQFKLGRFRDARRTWRDLEALYAAAHDDYARASVTYNLALEHLTAEADDRAKAEAALRRALRTARSGGHRSVEAMTSLLLGKLLSGRPRIELFERALELADAESLPVQRSDALLGIASTHVTDDPARAREALDEALALLTRSEDLRASSAHAWEARMRVAWATLPPDDAYAASLVVLDDLEILRARQLARGGRGDYFSRWNVANDWLAGVLFEQAAGRPIDIASLDAVEPPTRIETLAVHDPEALARAVLVLERRRARLLRETAELVTEARDAAPDDANRQLEALGDRMATLHRRLLTEKLPASERRAVEASLDALEAQEDAVWRRLETERRDAVDEAEADARAAAPPAVDLEALRRALAPDEALFLVQSGRSRDIYRHFAGGSWLAVATRDELWLHRLPEPKHLELAVDTFAGLLEAHDAEPGPAAEALWRLVLAPAIEALPPPVEHLIVLADGPLHRLPLAAIGPSTDALLGLRYAISRPPSAELWLDWRNRPSRRDATAAALVFADPALGEEDDDGATTRIATTRSIDGLELGRLPGAAAEARAVRRRLGRDTEILLGAEARETSLDTLDPGRFATIHFAAHALVDPRRERRSGVVLAPSGRDDGLLRPPEIARLPLDDQLVVLSACHGAAGRVLRGEGPLSLARSFFEAGARSVVAGLWRLRDDEAERFADAFYASLADGTSVARAARDARRALHDAGASSAAWAALVVLGDGALVPFSGPSESSFDERSWSRRAVWNASIVLLLGLLLAWLAVRRNPTDTK